MLLSMGEKTVFQIVSNIGDIPISHFFPILSHN